MAGRRSDAGVYAGVFATLNSPMADAWRRLGEKHGGARFVVTLLPVAYDDSAHEALVYLRVECGGLCGGGSLLRLDERDGKWTVVERQPLWAA